MRSLAKGVKTNEQDQGNTESGKDCCHGLVKWLDGSGFKAHRTPSILLQFDPQLFHPTIQGFVPFWGLGP